MSLFCFNVSIFLLILPCLRNFNFYTVFKHMYVWNHLKVLKRPLIIKPRDLNQFKILHNSLLHVQVYLIFVFALTLDKNTKKLLKLDSTYDDDTMNNICYVGMA